MREPDGALPANHPDAAWRRGFWSLIAKQFQNAFNDNGYKTLMTFVILGLGLSEATRKQLVLLVGALFSLPFIFFSMAGGYLADRYSKRSVMIGTKVLEVAIMSLALAALLRHSLTLEIAAVFLFSSQSAIFGP